MPKPISELSTRLQRILGSGYANLADLDDLTSIEILTILNYCGLSRVNSNNVVHLIYFPKNN